jgi:predicted transcriptional regulator
LALEHLLSLGKELGSKNAFSIIKTIENELLKIKPDQRLLVESAFRFIEVLAKDTERKFLIALDNFENLFDLNNFSQIKDVLSVVGFENENTSYIAASSAVRQCLSSLKSFESYELKNLEKNEAIELIESVIGKNEKAANEIFELSQGHPLVAALISKRYNEVKDAKKAFLIGLLQKNNSLHNYCSDSLDYYYNRARGQTLLKTILKVVANEELRLSEIAKRIYRSAPVTKSILERLMEVDVIYRKENKFHFSDNVLRLWVKLTSQGYEFDDVPDDRILDEVAKEL